MSNTKYELTDETIEYDGVTLHRIRALKDIFIKDFGMRNVQAGDYGGFVESETNLSKTGSCWIYDDAKVYGNAIVEDRASVCGQAIVRGCAHITGDSQVTNYALVEGNAVLCNNVEVSNESYVRDADIHSSVLILDSAEVYGGSFYERAMIRGRAKVYDGEIRGLVTIAGAAEIRGYPHIRDSATISGDARIYGQPTICGNAHISGNALVYGQAQIEGNADIKENAVVCEYMAIDGGTCKTDLRKSIEESIRCQTGLIPLNGEVIAYKVVRPNLTSIYDNNFHYKIGEWAEVDFYDDSILSCAEGLHFSNAHYWDDRLDDSITLIARIKLEDIIAVQGGKIRCKRAFILGSYKQS